MKSQAPNKGLIVDEPTNYASPPSEPTATEAQLVGVPRPGDEILGGKYEVERVIGVGGMGVVVAAFHKKLAQRVAVKFLSKQMQSAELVDRFIREGQACARIKSAHIASVLDVGLLENGTPYLMMEYLEGIDLDDYVAENGAIPVDDAVHFVIQACDALAVAHSEGIVHRDLKPSNLFVTQSPDGEPLIKVLDFGISKIGQSETNPNPRSTLTRPGTMLGSPRYVSPEQLRNASNVDHRADIWAIGIVLHELVAGRPPYVADTFADLCAMITTQAPIPLRQLVPDAPPELEKTILKCIEKNPDDRFQNVAELAASLAAIASDESRALALRVGRILEVASAKRSIYPATLAATKTPRRYVRSSTPNDGRADPTQLRSSVPRSSSAPSGAHASALSIISSKPFAKGWRGRLGGIIVIAGLIAIVVAVIGAQRRRARESAVSVATSLPPAPVVSLAPRASVEPAAAPPPAPAPTVAETAPAPIELPPAKLEPPAKAAPPKPAKPAVARPKAPPPPLAAPTTARPVQDESDMLNRRH